MRLPDLVAYQAAVQHPSTAFADPQLRAASVTTGRLGLPRAVAGNFAVTYQLQAGSRQWAVRCFHREAADRGSRYAAISQHLARLRAGPLVPIEYLDSGVRVGQAWYPITKMAWLEGRPLNRAVEESLSTPNALADIERRFVEMVTELRRLGIAHGDLQHGNVLVDGSGTLRLVDYDGMFVPSLRGRPASESGDPNYQHPRRTLQFDAELDRFAAITIVLALRALMAEPRLWQTYNTGDNLLFRRADFANPSASPLFRDLAVLTSMRELAQRFANICQAEYARVPTLDEFVGGVRPTMSARHVAVLNTLYARPRRERDSSRPRSWKLRRAAVQSSLACSPDGQVLASGDRDGRITLREAATGRTRRSLRLPRSAGSLRALAFAQSGDLMAVTTDGPIVCVWDVARQQKRVSVNIGGQTVRGLAVSSNAAWLVAGSDDGMVRCWKLAGGRLLGSFWARGAVTALAVSRDGRFIASAGPRVPLTIRHAPGGQKAADLSSSRGVTCLAFAADGARLAAGTSSGQCAVRHLRGSAQVQQVTTLSGPVEAVSLSPDGLAAAATSRDGSIALRRLAATRLPAPEPVQPLSATRVISSSYRLFDWLRRVALL